jgi:hypothetical protein
MADSPSGYSISIVFRLRYVSITKPIPPHPIGSPSRLSLQQFRRKIAIKSEKVSQFSCGIYLSLPNVFSLTQHRRRYKLVAMLGTDKVCGLEEDGRAVYKWRVLPVLFGYQGRLDRSRDLLFRSEREICE